MDIDGPGFFYYINDLPEVITNGKMVVYADDIILFVVGNNVEVVIDNFDKAFSNITVWCRNKKT